MSFVITARTILQLGAELISSDAVAIYELIKNAIDAKSLDGVQVDLEIVIRESEYANVLSTIESSSKVDALREAMFEKILPSAPTEAEKRFRKLIGSAKSVADFRLKAAQAYAECNQIVVADTGHGMSQDDLRSIFLTIGTTSRATSVRSAISAGEEDVPYLGEKGVGRLSAMRLGRRLRVETATAKDKHINVLDIDWRAFEEAYDRPASEIKLEPTIGPIKPKSASSFTRITISDLRGTWSKQKLSLIAAEQISRMMDPFSWKEKRRFPIRLLFNGDSVDQARTVAQDLLNHAHASCIGDFTTQPHPKLTVTFATSLYGGAPTTHEFDVTDLMGLSGLAREGYPSSVLRSMGPFKFEFYWFNRQRLRALEGVGDRERVRELIHIWSGICLFRNGYRVLPYGDQGDDWLNLDRRALASSGYKLNTKQLIGRVRIGRSTNPKLLDQTNRQGLVDTNEKNALIDILNALIANWWRDYLNDANRVQKRNDVLVYDAAREGATVTSLEKRTNDALKGIGKKYTGDGALLQEVKDAFLEIKDAHTRAIARIETIEEQKERLTQLAGIGLMIEVVAHELTRATEATEITLKSLKAAKLDPATRAVFKVLGEQLKVIHRRLQTLEPLSITARQRRSTVNLHDVASYIMEAHTAQFARHQIRAEITADSDDGAVAFAIEGHIVQILENLINNSVFWLDFQRKEHSTFKPSIKIAVRSSPPRITYSDNGPGIPTSRTESVFEPFFSTKGGASSRRQGLGLYIARQNAELLGGTLVLVDDNNVRAGRLNTFELELKEQP